SHASITVFFFTATPPPDLYTLSLHDALPIWRVGARSQLPGRQPLPAQHAEADEPGELHDGDGWLRAVLDRGSTGRDDPAHPVRRSEEHTSELQSRFDLVCRLLLEKKKKNQNK